MSLAGRRTVLIFRQSGLFSFSSPRTPYLGSFRPAALRRVGVVTSKWRALVMGTRLRQNRNSGFRGDQTTSMTDSGERRNQAPSAFSTRVNTRQDYPRDCSSFRIVHSRACSSPKATSCSAHLRTAGIGLERKGWALSDSFRCMAAMSPAYICRWCVDAEKRPNTASSSPQVRRTYSVSGSTWGFPSASTNGGCR